MNRGRPATTLAIVIVAIGFLVWTIRTQPRVPTAGGPGSPAAVATPLPDPLALPLLDEMRNEHHLDVGSPPDHALSVALQGGRVEVTLSEELLKDLGPGTLDKLGLPERTASFTWSKYLEFLGHLHVLVAARHPGTDEPVTK